jgi:hypothetical protein
MRRGPRKHHNPNGHIQPLSVRNLEALLYGAPLPDLHAQKRLEEARAQAQSFVNNPKENEMSDIKTALQKALADARRRTQEEALHQTLESWAKEDEQANPQAPITKEQQTQLQPQPQPQENNMPRQDHYFRPTNNISRSTFEYILNNPGKSFTELCVALTAMGFKKSSFTSLISQMRRSGLIACDSTGHYTALTAQYKPIKNGKAAHTTAPTYKRRKPGPMPKAKANAAPQVDTTEQHAQPMRVVTLEVDYILNNMPIKQARELYDALHKIFGSNA